MTKHVKEAEPALNVTHHFQVQEDVTSHLVRIATRRRILCINSHFIRAQRILYQIEVIHIFVCEWIASASEASPVSLDSAFGGKAISLRESERGRRQLAPPAEDRVVSAAKPAHWMTLHSVYAFTAWLFLRVRTPSVPLFTPASYWSPREGPKNWKLNRLSRGFMQCTSENDTAKPIEQRESYQYSQI